MSVRLHREHGLNPTIPICIFCGEDRNELVLLSAAYKDEAPRHMVMDLKPCDKCEEMLKTHIAFIEVDGDGKPTTRVVSVKEEVVNSIIKGEELLKDMRKKRMCYVPREDFDQMFGHVLR